MKTYYVLLQGSEVYMVNHQGNPVYMKGIAKNSIRNSIFFFSTTKDITFSEDYVNHCFASPTWSIKLPDNKTGDALIVMVRNYNDNSLNIIDNYSVNGDQYYTLRSV